MTRGEEWYESANCATTDPELFFGDRTKAARRICDECPVLEMCLEAVMTEEGTLNKAYRHGVVAGLTPTQRYALSRKRRRAA